MVFTGVRSARVPLRQSLKQLPHGTPQRDTVTKLHLVGIDSRQEKGRCMKKATKEKIKLKNCCENEPFIPRVVVSWVELCVYDTRSNEGAFVTLCFFNVSLDLLFIFLLSN
jgi:hypothetical protein